MEEDKFVVTSHDLDNLRVVMKILHSFEGSKKCDEEREVYPYYWEPHSDTGHPGNRISPLLNDISVMHIGADNIDGLSKLLMTIYCDAKLKVKVDEARAFLKRLLDEGIVTEWKPVFPGLRSRGYFRKCLQSDSEGQLLVFYHGSWRTVTQIEEQPDAQVAFCSFDNPYPETRDARPILKIKVRYDSLYVISVKALNKLQESKSNDREFFVQWLSAAVKMASAEKQHFINIEAMFENPVFAS